MKDETLKTKIELEQPSDDSLFAQGHMLGGQYKILNLLGAGGMGSVYKVQQIFSNKNFALKVLDLQRIFDEVQLRRFQLEAKATHMLDHPNLVKVHDLGLLESNQPYLIMDLVAGRTLADYLKENGPLETQEALRVFVQVCFGLMHAHENSIVHRDIKPSNIMLVDGLLLGAEGSVKILDFGIAKLLDREGGEIQQLTRTGEVFGSPLYMSPEQCTGTGIDQRSDIYSLGCVLFEALTGTPPHVGSTALRTLMLHQTEEAPTLRMAGNGKEFPRELEAIVSKMLKKSPNERYETLGAVAQDLSILLYGQSAPKSSIKITPVVETKKIAEPHLVSLSPLTFAALTAALIGLSAYSTSVGLALMYPKPEHLKTAAVVAEPQKPVADPTQDYSGNKQPDFLAEIHRAAPPKEKLQEFQHVIDTSPMVHATRTGKTAIELNFPPEFAFGHVRVLKHLDTGFWKPIGDPVAHGTVKIHDGPQIKMGLKIEASKFMSPLFADDTLKIIDPSIFYELSIKGVPSFSTTAHGLTLAKHLDYASKWTELKRLQLSELPLTAKALSNLNRMPGLEAVAISSPIIDDTDTLPSQFWVQLKEVSLIGLKSENILLKLNSSKNLSRLYLEDADVTSKGLSALNNCPNLRHIDIIASSLDDSTVEALSKMPSLKNINMENVKLTSAQIKILGAAKNLTAIGISAASIAEVDSLNDRRFYVTRERDD